MAVKKRTRAEIEADLQKLKDEYDATPDENEDGEEDEGSEHIIVFRGAKGLDKFLASLGSSSEEEEEEEEGDEDPDEDSEGDQEEDGDGDENEDPPAPKKRSQSAKSSAPNKATPKTPVKDAQPKPRSKWFGDR